MKFKQIRRIVMWVLLVIGIGMIILIQIVERNELTNWQDPITMMVWMYLIITFIYIFFYTWFQRCGNILRGTD
ncbi:hypothetical protein RYX56_14860 [Alkalihalophilus lindianensis]|uniref:Uncharacterized protein n=1 Tax=Alkalihalophilus lindianensis TaxID=1630542 RepID=A0ABU3XCM9_9BACI|nr:hypothetical protein [Alkalihalophilus lindianensis]MDV2685643.1 hypothetical protein [Alkalihalophilus lindianensis]